MYGHDLFQISGVPVWFRSHRIFECYYTLGGYKASKGKACMVKEPSNVKQLLYL
jgi:hypothetical protein